MKIVIVIKLSIDQEKAQTNIFLYLLIKRWPYTK